MHGQAVRERCEGLTELIAALLGPRARSGRPETRPRRRQVPV